MPTSARSTSDVSALDFRPGDRSLWVVGPVGLRYGPAWDLQKALLRARVEQEVPDVLLLVEHPPVYTIGRRGGDEHLLVGPTFLESKGAEVFHIDRGGDITFHGPGQLVGYPILDLTDHRRDVHWYLRQLEESLIRTLAEFGIRAGRQEGLTGVWIGDEKVAAIGIKVSRWVTMHGFALNVTTDLRYFDYIVPCGISDKRVTSMERLLGRPVSLSEVARVYVRAFGELFRLRPRNVSLTALVEHVNRRGESVPNAAELVVG